MIPLRKVLHDITNDVVVTERHVNGLLVNHGRKFGDYGSHVQNWAECTGCRLHRTRGTSCVGTGSLDARIIAIGEGPGPTENENGVIFSGLTGTLLRQTMEKIGFDLLNDVYFTNSVACLPTDVPGGRFRKPTPTEITTCAPRIAVQEGLVTGHKVVILLGKTAFLSWKFNHEDDIDVGELDSQTRVKDILGWHGPQWINEGTEDLPYVYCTYHPSYVERQKSYGSKEEWLKIMQAWIYDLAAVKKYVDTGEIVHPRR